MTRISPGSRIKKATAILSGRPDGTTVRELSEALGEHLPNNNFASWFNSAMVRTGRVRYLCARVSPESRLTKAWVLNTAFVEKPAKVKAKVKTTKAKVKTTKAAIPPKTSKTKRPVGTKAARVEEIRAYLMTRPTGASVQDVFEHMNEDTPLAHFRAWFHTTLVRSGMITHVATIPNPGAIHGHKTLKLWSWAVAASKTVPVASAARTYAKTPAGYPFVADVVALLKEHPKGMTIRQMDTILGVSRHRKDVFHTWFHNNMVRLGRVDSVGKIPNPFNDPSHPMVKAWKLREATPSAVATLPEPMFKTRTEVLVACLDQLSAAVAAFKAAIKEGAVA
jgi:hypothetical protein